jgi:hypothetical protein
MKTDLNRTSRQRTTETQTEATDGMSESVKKKNLGGGGY